MESPLLSHVEQFLQGLEEIQSELEDLFEVKRRVLVQGHAEEILRTNDRERNCAARLHVLLSFRNRILARVREQDAGIQSLEEAALRFQFQEGWSRIPARIRKIALTQAKLRQASWTHWIISHRCYNHYTEILDLIAHHGHKEPAYSQVPHQTVTGGTVLDASI